MKQANPKRRNQISRQLKREGREAKAQERFVASPTPKKARHTARAEANAAYKPVLRGLRSEVAGSNKREGELSGWYGGLTAQNQQAQQSAASTSAAQEKALTERLNTAGAADSSALAAQASKNAELAKQLGGPTNTAGQAEAAKGVQALAQQRVALTSPISTERASSQGYLAQRGISATERGIEAHKAETSRRRKIKEDLRAGKKERGQAFVSNLEKLREGARDYSIQKQAFGQKGKEFAAERQENAIERAQKARENAADRSVSRFSAGSTRISAEASRRSSNASARNATTAERKLRKEGKSGGLTPTQRRSAHRLQKNANVTAHSLYSAAKKKPSDPASWNAFVILVGKEVGDQVAAKKAVGRLKASFKRQQAQGTRPGFNP